MNDRSAAFELPSALPQIEPGQQALWRLDNGLHTLYVAQGRIRWAPAEATLLVQEAISLIEATIPDLRRQLRDRPGSAEDE